VQPATTAARAEQMLRSRDHGDLDSVTTRLSSLQDERRRRAALAVCRSSPVANELADFFSGSSDSRREWLPVRLTRLCEASTRWLSKQQESAQAPEVLVQSPITVSAFNARPTTERVLSCTHYRPAGATAGGGVLNHTGRAAGRRRLPTDKTTTEKQYSSV